MLLRRQEPSSAASTRLLPTQEHGAQFTGNGLEAAARWKRRTHSRPAPPSTCSCAGRSPALPLQLGSCLRRSTALNSPATGSRRLRDGKGAPIRAPRLHPRAPAQAGAQFCRFNWAPAYAGARHVMALWSALSPHSKAWAGRWIARENLIPIPDPIPPSQLPVPTRAPPTETACACPLATRVRRCQRGT